MGISAKLRRLVIARADNRCEYCQLSQEFAKATFQIDHVRAEKHSGETDERNLALACFHCNNHKGPNIAGIDPVTDELQPLFNPRAQAWNEHFEWSGSRLLGITPTGRATIEVFAINQPDRIALRQMLIDEGVFPP